MMSTKKHSLKCISYQFLGIILAFHISVFWEVTKGDLENITARDILQKNLETIANRPPMMADGEVVDKVDRTAGTIENKFISRIYLDNKQHDITRNKWKLEDDKWVNINEIRGIWDGSRYTGSLLTMEHTNPFGRRPDHLSVTYSDRSTKYTVGWGTWAFGLGLTAGDGHFAKPLSESETLRLRPEMEQVDGFECYVLEGDTRDYHYTVWIDPDHGYLHRKIIGEGHKTEKLVKRLLEVTGVKIESFDGIPMVTEATRHVFSEYIDGNTIDLTAREKISNIVWNPDFEKEGAFKLDNIPNGTPVSYFADNMNETGIKFHWQDGKIVANIDDLVVEQIDKMTEEILTEDQASNSLETTQKNEITTNEPAITKKVKLERHVDTAKGRGDVLSETRPFYTLLLIPIGLLIIGIIFWMICRIKGRKS